MDNSLFLALRSAYAEYWSGLVNGATLSAIAFFIVGAAIFFIVFEARGKNLSLVAIARYVFPRDQHVHASSRADRWNWLLVYLWVPPIKATATIVALVAGINLSDVLVEQFGARGPLFTSTWAIGAVQVSAIYLSVEFSRYWLHRALHEIPILWSFHRVHHSAETLTFFTAPRNHPVEWLFAELWTVACQGLSAGLVLYATGSELRPFTLPGLLAVQLVFGVINALAHSHCPLSFGKLDYVIGGPVLHQFHHSAEPRHRDKNYSIGLMIFDRMFGTLYLPKGREVYRWGLNAEELGEKNPHNQVRAFYLEPFRHAWGVFRGFGRMDFGQRSNPSNT